MAEPAVLRDAPAEGVVRLTLNRPERLNALGREVLAALSAEIGRAVAGGARVLLLTGSGRAFCAGADLKERRGMDAEARLAHNRAIGAAVAALAAAPMPTLAALNGLALGGGLELALACDLRLAAADAQLGLTEARIGGIPGAGGTQRLPRLIGPARALEMILTGDPVSAATAADWGLVNAALPDAALPAEAARLAAHLAGRSASAAALAKAAVHEGLAGTLAEGLAIEHRALLRAFATADYAEGLAAFAEKRPPRFNRAPG
jgi:enoyl-CoA hydratase/carnithine racemase